MRAPFSQVLQKLTVMILLWALASEIGSRLYYKALPSLDPSPADPTLHADCNPSPDAPIPLPAWTQTFNQEAQTQLHIVVSGDSVALGTGVLPRQSFSWLLGKQLADETHHQVRVTNLSVNGGGACDTVGRLLTYLDHERADLVLAAFFADDLQEYTAVSSEGQLHLDPQRIDGLPAKTLLTHSYAANWIWWQSLQRLRSTNKHPLTLESREVSQGLNRLAQQSASQGVSSVLTLLAPTGAQLCSSLRADSRPLEECAQLAAGGERVHALLKPFGDDYLDLRTLWNTSTSPLQAEEHVAMEEIQRLPVHPNETGHQRIADALWPALFARSLGVRSAQ